MNFLDMRTVILGHFFTNILCTAVLAFVWAQNRKRFAGAGWWLSDFAFQALAIALVILRGYLPDWISIIVANTLVFAGAIMGYIGLTLFVGKKSPQLHNYALLIVFAIVHSYFVYVQPDLAARNINLPLGLLAVYFQCVWLVLRRVEPDMRQMARWVGNAFWLLCLVSIARIVATLVNPSPSADFFQSGLFDTTILLTYQILRILLAFSFITMVNQRLLVDIQFQEKKYATIFRSSPYAITLTRLSDGEILDVNDRFTVISGYSYDEAVGKTRLELNLWAKEEDRTAVVRELSQGMRVSGREYQFRKKSGEMVIGMYSAEIISIHKQQWVLSSLDDITKQGEQKLATLLERLDLAAKAANLGIWDWDIQKNELVWDDQMYALYRVQREDFSGAYEAWLAGIHPDDREASDTVSVQARRGEREYDTEFRIVWPDGTIRTLKAYGMVIRDPAGNPVRMTGVNYDITERKQAEAALRASQEDFQRYFNMNTVGMAVTAPDKGWIEVNARLSQMLGYSFEELSQLTWAELTHPDDLERDTKQFNRVLAGEIDSYQLDKRFIHKNKSVVYTTLFVSCHRNPDRSVRHCLTSLVDITEKKQAEEELRAQRHALNERVKELDCLYGIANLIETPNISLEEILQGTVELLPPAWQQPSRTCARLTLQEQTYRTSNFQQTDWRLSSEITINGSPIGMLEVFLLEKPVHDDEVYLPEESKLLYAVAERISRVIERVRVEEALHENEVIFSSFLENSPVYVFFKDKNIRTLRLSRNYEQMLGMPVSETIGKSMDELFPSLLAKSMVADDLQILKDGKRVDIVEKFNNRVYETTKFPIYMDGKPEMLAGFTMDITDRKRNETILQLRLKLLEYAAIHSLDELMQYALDEIGELTQSPIGFYHFVEPDEKTLSLQAWSTRTLQEFCQTDGKDLHYPIDQAGVWVDCVAQRKPVIHNDYNSLPYRKGLPPGHAQVVRELVTPIFRDGRVVAILGVGNKPTDYDEADSASVSYIADVLFEIAKRKQTEEDLKKATEQLSLRLTEIEQLHEELREQSIRDPLTGAYNRRYMQDVIVREFSRAVRENFPVSVIMLDMDELKIFNDTYGHHMGDEAIKKLAVQIKDMIRTEDIVCRFGGDEFVIILGKTSPENAIKRVNEWREALYNNPLAVEGKKMPVLFTAGIASFPVHGGTMEEVINYADVALYRAKARGRNCTMMFV